ncbi:hypothetical protein B0H13DRAFT_1850103 [Mycena leptocephala]|nr:hypothetical protein B0H13DRAFT_1850103 [Mycena leptocephala]
MVLANPGWGFAPEMKDEKHAVDAVMSVISSVLISKRNTVKTVILSSLGSDPVDPATSALRPGTMNIVDLATAILNKLKRKLVSENDDNKYWGDVDKNLVSAREKHSAPVKQSRFIKRYILDPDLETYGAVELNSFATPSVPVAGPSSAPANTCGESDARDWRPPLSSHREIHSLMDPLVYPTYNLPDAAPISRIISNRLPYQKL